MALTLKVSDVKIWERFQERRFSPEEIASDPLLSRWARSEEARSGDDDVGADDLTTLEDSEDGELENLLAPDSPFHGFANAMAGNGYSGLLSNGSGHIIHRRVAPALQPKLFETSLVERACWSEDRRGTNGIGTALIERVPTAVVGAAHSDRKNHELCCYAAPVIDVRGEVAAVIDASGRSELAHPALLAVVMTTAGALETRLVERAYDKAVRGGWLGLEARVRSSPHAAFVVERTGRIRLSNPGFSMSFTLKEQAQMAEAVAQRFASSEEVAGVVQVGKVRLAIEPVGVMSNPFAAIVQVEHIPETTSVTRTHVRHSAFAEIAGDDPEISAAIDKATRFAMSNLPVLLLAETGTGKELFARAIHGASPRAAQPFIAINCGALTGSLLESELFGYASGAFTGARVGGSEGRLAAAHGGTLFLDEIAEMSVAVQVMLLRFLEDHSYYRVGDTRERHADVRILAATSRDLPALVRSGEFRSDLYYRIRGATIRLPPLRDRKDIVALSEALLARIAERLRLPRVHTLSEPARQWLQAQPWPGNVRELATALEHAVVWAEDRERIEIADFPVSDDIVADQTTDLRAHAERLALVRAVGETGGNLSAAARLLGVSRGTLYRMLRRHRVDPT